MSVENTAGIKFSYIEKIKINIPIPILIELIVAVVQYYTHYAWLFYMLKPFPIY